MEELVKDVEYPSEVLLNLQNNDNNNLKIIIKIIIYNE